VAGRDLLLQSFPVLKENESKGNYSLHTVYNEQGSDVAIAFNMIHPDPVLNKIFGDVRWRQAMSLAVDRDEINELVFLGQGTPRQATINSSAKFYKDEWGNSFAKLDLDQANKLLDEIGLDKKGPDGVRLRPDGQPMAFQLEYLPQQGPKKEVCELVVKHWAKVGVKCDAQARERAFLLQRVTSGQHDASGWMIDRTLERTTYTYGWSGSKLGPGGNSALVFAQGWADWLQLGPGVCAGLGRLAHLERPARHRAPRGGEETRRRLEHLAADAHGHARIHPGCHRRPRADQASALGDRNLWARAAAVHRREHPGERLQGGQLG
jgi:peptide/nickel transport system substrate-binding protein